MANPAELVAENFCIKYEPPTFAILYYFTSNPTAKFVHNVELDVTPNSNPRDITNRLFENESLYLDHKAIQVSQVEKLINKIIMRKRHKPEEELKKEDPLPKDNTQTMSKGR